MTYRWIDDKGLLKKMLGERRTDRWTADNVQDALHAAGAQRDGVPARATGHGAAHPRRARQAPAWLAALTVHRGERNKTVRPSFIVNATACGASC
jgi:hypothetical protein